MKKLCVFLLSLVLISACNGNTEYYYPKGKADLKEERSGKMRDEGGVLDFLNTDAKKSGGAYIGVNSYLWRASLDVISFMPLASADPFGGVIITDWYQDATNKMERVKMNIVISNTTLQSDAVKVSVFKQKSDGKSWRDLASNEHLARELEDKILTRAKELKIKGF